ncbi:MAG: hypothetical protein BIFFINMI_00790 [Phycisphaerae bacterium]|nr:hypothetical protein [Phycisphaerae bacterium]
MSTPLAARRWIAILGFLAALLTMARVSAAEQRTVVVGPLTFESSQKLLEFLPTVDVGTHKAFPNCHEDGWVFTQFPLVQFKLRLFLSPGYMLSHHEAFLQASYDDANIRPGGTLPVTFRLQPAGTGSYLRSGAGAICEAKWRIGVSLGGFGVWIENDIPYLPNFNCGYQAHVGGYTTPMPNGKYTVGAKSDLGDEIPITLYDVAGKGELQLVLQPGLFFALRFKDMTARVAVSGAESISSGGTAVPVGQPTTLVHDNQTGHTFNVTLPADLRELSDFRIVLTGIDYQDDVKISPTMGFALGVKVELGASSGNGEQADEDETEGGGEPPDGEDNDLEEEKDESEISGQKVDFGKVTISWGEIGYTTPSYVWDMGSGPLGNLFTLGWNLPLNRPDTEVPIAIPPMPDLMIPSATIANDNRTLTSSVEVDNQGSADAGAFQVKWILEKSDGSTVAGVPSPLWTQAVNSLAAGDCVTLSKSLTLAADLPLGSYRLRVQADTAGSGAWHQVVEQCEVNNEAQATLSSTLDLGATLGADCLFRQQACAAGDAAPASQRMPGRRYWIKAAVTRRAADIAAPMVPVEVWAQRHRCPIAVQGVGDNANYGGEYYGPSVLIARRVVALGMATSASVVVPWDLPAREDANWEIRVKVDPQGQVTQWLPGGQDATANDLAWAWRRFERPRFFVNGMGARPGPGVADADWTIGSQTTYYARVRNSSDTAATGVPVQLFVAGRMVSETTLDIAPWTDGEITFTRPFSRDDLFRDFDLGGGMVFPRVFVRAVIDPRDEVEDQNDGLTNADQRYIDAPPIGDLEAELSLPSEPAYAGEAQAVRVGAGNAYRQSFPAGALGKVGASAHALVGETEQHQEQQVAQGQIDQTPPGQYLAHTSTNWGVTTTWYTWEHVRAYLPAVQWVPQASGLHLFTAHLTVPVAPAWANSPERDKYISDLNSFDNGVVRTFYVGLPRPDLQVARVYAARMPSRGDLADLRRLSGRIAESLAGGRRADALLAEDTGRAYAGAPVTIAVDVINPPPSADYPPVAALNVRVNLYAVYQPEWKKHRVLADISRKWSQLETQLPGLGRPIRQFALYVSERDRPTTGRLLVPTPISITTPRAAHQFTRPAAGSFRPTTGGRLPLNRPDAAELASKTALDLLHEFNQAQTEVLLVGTQVLPRVEAGAVATFQWRPPHGGDWLLSAVVDPGDEIFERDEQNNSADMLLDARPTPHYFANTPPHAVLGVRVGRGVRRSEFVESVLAQRAGDEPKAPKTPDSYPVDREVGRMWDALDAAAAKRFAALPALSARRTITIRQGQTFTLVGQRTVDREHDVAGYWWSGPSLSEVTTEPCLVVDTSLPGQELGPGTHVFWLTATDSAGLYGRDCAFVTVVKGGSNAANLAPAGVQMLPAGPIAGQLTSLHVAVVNDGGGATGKAFAVQVFDGQTRLGEVTCPAGLAAGDVAEISLPDAWTPTAGLHALRVVVDPGHQVAESSESDNTMALALRVTDNAPPVADLGSAEFTVQAGHGLFLDAYRSYDPDGRLTRYDWFVNNRLENGVHGRRFRYVAPNRAGDVKVKLVVADNGTPPRPSAAFEAVIHVVKDRNREPVVQLPSHLIVTRGRQITIPAVGCYDGDGKISSYQWKVKGLEAREDKGHAFVIDTAKAKTGVYEVKLEIADNRGATASGSTMLYVVDEPNRAPVLDIAPNVIAVRGEKVTLDASHSRDVDGTIADYLWIVPPTAQVAAGPKFVLDTATLKVGLHLVILAVSDNDGATTTRPIAVTVLPLKGQPLQSDTGYDPSKPLNKQQLQQIDGNPPTDKPKRRTDESPK